MNNKEEFKKNWEKQRKKGQLWYVLVNVIKVIIGFSIGILIANTYLPRYSFPHFFYAGIGLILAWTIRYMYEWGKNEDKYRKLIDKQ